MIREARERARRKGLTINITKDDLAVPDMCPILGIPLAVASGQHGPGRGSPTIDRIDATRGYERDNVQVISCLANRMKNDATFAELRLFCTSILSMLDRLDVGRVEAA